jgi:hypothetical protein
MGWGDNKYWQWPEFNFSWLKKKKRKINNPYFSTRQQ